MPTAEQRSNRAPGMQTLSRRNVAWEESMARLHQKQVIQVTSGGDLTLRTAEGWLRDAVSRERYFPLMVTHGLLKDEVFLHFGSLRIGHLTERLCGSDHMAFVRKDHLPGTRGQF